MTVDEFTHMMSSMAEVIKTKSTEEAEKIIIDAFETSNLDIQQICEFKVPSREKMEALQHDVALVLQFVLQSKESIKSQLQDIKKFHKARESYTNHCSS